jgi:hypothetical protein
MKTTGIETRKISIPLAAFKDFIESINRLEKYNKQVTDLIAATKVCCKEIESEAQGKQCQIAE